MVEHTPGPWTVEIDESPWAGPIGYVYGPPMEESAFINEADARLIAAAPDLLAILREIENSRSLYHARRKARAAIAKATGKD